MQKKKIIDTIVVKVLSMNEIEINITKDDINKCAKFSKEIIYSDNQYNRFSKSKLIQFERTLLGKLGEYLFLKFLNQRQIDYQCPEMFQIFQGKENVDSHDFVMPSRKLIDIKVASKSFHTKIMIPLDQFKLRKDFYVGIKIHTSQDKNNKTDFDKISNASVFGYCDRLKLENQPIWNFGEGRCKYISLYKLEPIDDLIQLWKDGKNKNDKDRVL